MDLRQLEANAAENPPTAPDVPSVGYPTNGDPAQAIPAGKPGDYWFHQIAEELRHVITQGGVTPDHENLTQLYEAISALISAQTGAVGSVQSFAMDTEPDGWMECDGSAVSRAAFSDLFTAVGTVFGAGDGSTTFNLPDLRGEFIRGWDNGRGVDSGRVFGSTQADELKAHSHEVVINNTNNIATGTGAKSTLDGITGSTRDPGTLETGGSETRPRNVAMMLCIKY